MKHSTKAQLMMMEWNSFSIYPPQGKSIYLRCEDSECEYQTKVVLVKMFNAVSFNPADIASPIPVERARFEWLPAEAMEEIAH